MDERTASKDFELNVIYNRITLKNIRQQSLQLLVQNVLNIVLGTVLDKPFQYIV